MTIYEKAECKNGHELLMRWERGTIIAVATSDDESEHWEFVNCAFCPKCGAEIALRNFISSLSRLGLESVIFLCI